MVVFQCILALKASNECSREGKAMSVGRMVNRVSVKAVLFASVAACVLSVQAMAAGPDGAATDQVLPGMEQATQSALAAKTLILASAHTDAATIAVGQWGHVVISTDNGKTWTQAKTNPTRETLTSVSFSDTKNGWAAGHGGTIIHTTDGGETWTRQLYRPDLGGPLLAIYFTSATTGFAAGAYGMFFETKDGGTTWTQRTVSDGDLHFNEIFGGPDNVIYIAGEAGFGYKSTDAGATWTKMETGYVGSFWAGEALADGTILLAGMRGNVYRSTDGGKTFAASKTGTEKSITGLTVLSDGTIIGVGLGGTVIQSKDGGANFQAYTRPDRLTLSAVNRGADGSVIVFGEKGAQVQDLKVFGPAS
jgi:photosystem II stability/assembly factor-like uncharacterized protein